MDNDTLEAASRIIQQALTPVFLLSGVASLVNVFATRLGRVSDQADKLSKEPQAPLRDAQLRILRWRSRSLDAAVLLAALAGGLTCGAAIALFFGEVLGHSAATALFLLFGGALILAMCSLTAFVVEMLMAARSVRHVVERSVGQGATV